MDATEQAALIRNGEASVQELVDAAIARVEKVNGELNAVIHERFDRARMEAAGALPDGPLRGVPFVIKDLGAPAAGDPFHAGIAAVKAAGYVADHDSVLVERFRAAGLVCIGRTNTPELGLVPTTEPEAYGASRNPWNPAHSTGGSSGGSGAAVAAGMVAVGHANDGGGSIRIPASECGLVGLKPSRGRVPFWPDAADDWAGLVQDLAVTRTVRDTAAVLDAVAGPCPGDLHTPPAPARSYGDEVGADPGRLRIGLVLEPADGATTVQPDVRRAVERAARLLESLGHRVEPTVPDGWVNPDLVGSFLPCLATWTAGHIAEWEARLGRDLTAQDMEPGTWSLVEGGRALTAPDYLAALNGLHQWSATVNRWWAGGWDVVLTPTIAEPPPSLGQFRSTAEYPLTGVLRAAAIVAFTVPFNVTGQPAISLPLGTSDGGLPIGVQLVAGYGRDDVLIRLAAQLEAAAPWADRRPPIFAG